MSKQDIKIVLKHNAWRRGGKGKMADPKRLGEALDSVVAMAERFEEMESALKVIHTWAAFPPLNGREVQDLCKKALRMQK